MLEPFQKATADFQKLSKDNQEALLRTYAELNKGFQAVGTRMTDYSKQAFQEATRTFEKLASAKSFEHAVEIQSQYVKSAFDKWVAEATKISELYSSTAREAYKPVEQAVTKNAS